jgi:hypothetical protein
MVTKSDAKIATGINLFIECLFIKNNVNHGRISIVNKINFPINTLQKQT